MADIHFQPNVAMMVADAFEKIRINPGASPCQHGPGRRSAGLPHTGGRCLPLRWQAASRPLGLRHA